MRLIDWEHELVCKVANHEVPRFGDGERGFDGLQIAHLSPSRTTSGPAAARI